MGSDIVILHLKPLARDGDPPLPVRIRRLLKAALRQHGFKCEHVSWLMRGAEDDYGTGLGESRESD